MSTPIAPGPSISTAPPPNTGGLVLNKSNSVQKPGGNGTAMGDTQCVTYRVTGPAARLSYSSKRHATGEKVLPSPVRNGTLTLPGAPNGCRKPGFVAGGMPE